MTGQLSFTGLSPNRIGDCSGYVDSLGTGRIDPKSQIALRFKNGLAPVKVNGLWGLINEEGMFVLEPEFRALWGFDGNTAKAIRGEDYCKIIVADKRVIVKEKSQISKETLEVYRTESTLTPHPHQERSGAYHRGGKRRTRDECW